MEEIANTHRVKRLRRSISLVIPAWNEADGIGRAVEEADTALGAIAERYEIIVVDDGSADGTSAIVRGIACTNPSVRLVMHEVNLGYGAALKSGFAAASCELVAFTDADSQFDLMELDRLVLLAHDYDVVCGYRIDRKDSWSRCLYSRVYNVFVRTLLRTGVRDVDCALKLFRREAIGNLASTTDGFLVNAEMLARARELGSSVVEVGVSHRPRVTGRSSVSVAHIPLVLTSLLRFWWNRIQFPGVGGDMGETPSSRSNPRWRWMQAVLLLLAALLLLSNLNYPLLDRDETRYGEIAREMVTSGNWVAPQLNFEPYYDKPVLLYWLCAMSYSAFGVSPGAARLVPAVCGLLTLASTMWFGTRAFGSKVGFLGGLVLLLSVGFLGSSRILLMDGVLTCFTAISLFAAYATIHREKFDWRSWIVASIAAALGFLTKGPIALVLLGPPVALHSWLTTGTARIRLRHWLFLLAIVALINVPWFVAVSHQEPGFAWKFFYLHNVQRFAGAFHDHTVWYFVPILLIAGHPWTSMTLPCLTFLFSAAPDARRTRPPSLGFLLLWSSWCIGFFSLSRCKLPTYIFPAAPALALIMAHFIARGVFSRATSGALRFARRWSPWLAASLTCLGGLGIAIFAASQHMESWTATAAACFAWTLALGVIAMLQIRESSPKAQWASCLAVTIVLCLVVVHREMPRLAEVQTVFGEGSPMVAIANRSKPAIATLGHEWAGVPFDLNRNDVSHFDSVESPEFRAFLERGRDSLIVIQSRWDLARLRASLPHGMQLTKVAEHGPAWLLSVETPVHDDARITSKPDVIAR